MVKQNGKQFDIGTPVFWKGNTFKVVAFQGNNVVVYSETHKSDSALVVPRWQVEDVATELFAIGDPVKSQHYFQGKVVGFEPEDNRVVCVSTNKSNPDRVRYAYKPHEIEKIPQMPAFKPSQISFIRFIGNPFFVKVWAFVHPDDTSLLHLCDVSTGKVVITVPAETTAEGLLDDFHIEFRKN